MAAVDSGWFAGCGIDPELAPEASPLFIFLEWEAQPNTKKLKLSETRKIFFISLGRRVVGRHSEINHGDGESE
ncbi:hypothetical protein [Methylacidimicrobium sp. AP8]|uniref:hypothetical protein n=1 Tax=Methylacidimicrobium sp. AP8 TaxID=2730359 RepID=UPI001F475D18|nr:hypothetical protein [Methylacidimicrobium sp. AP8]